MVKIVIENMGGKELLVKDEAKTVLKHLQENFIDWMHACGGKGRCTTCKMIVIDGQNGLAKLTEAEQRYREKGALKNTERLACQAVLLDNILIRVPQEGKMPHMHYTG